MAKPALAPVESDPEFAAIDWSALGLETYEATLQAVTLELAEPLDRGSRVSITIEAVATFVGAGTDNRQKATLKAISANLK